MIFIDSALTVHLVGQSTLNPGYSNDMSFRIFCSIASLLGDFLIRLEISYVVSIRNRAFFTISLTAKFKACPEKRGIKTFINQSKTNNELFLITSICYFIGHYRAEYAIVDIFLLCLLIT